MLEIRHEDLTSEQTAALRSLFDAEYLADFGPWDPDLPYGYAPHDVHLVAMTGTVVAGHVGWGTREIEVGGHPVVVAGVGGVLISPRARGQYLGQRLMDTARQSMTRDPDVAFGYLGCREAVAPFYESCGWTRIHAAERWTDRNGTIIDSPAGSPLFIVPISQPVDAWPVGRIDLRGRAW